MRKQITVKWDWGAELALKTEPNVKRILTGIVLRPGGKMYELAWNVETSWHQDVEIELFPEKKKPGFAK